MLHENGVNVRQLSPITMEESRSATHFADTDSIRGIAACAAFTMGCWIWGRRPHTLTAIKLRDIELTAHITHVEGAAVLVPHLRVRFTDEKFEDWQGHRHSHDTPHVTGYTDLQWCSCACWVFKLLVLRGIFDTFDPRGAQVMGKQCIYAMIA